MPKIEITPREIIVMAVNETMGWCDGFDEGTQEHNPDQGIADAAIAALDAAGFVIVPKDP